MHDVCFNKFLFINHQSIHFIRIFVYSIINLNFNSIVICNFFLLYIFIKMYIVVTLKWYIDIEIFHYSAQNEHQQATNCRYTNIIDIEIFCYIIHAMTKQFE